MHRRGDHQPTVTTDAKMLAGLSEPSSAVHPYLAAAERSDSWLIGKIIVVGMGIIGGIYGWDAANGGLLLRRLLTPALSCSDPGVIDLASQVLRDQFANSEAGAGTDPKRTSATLEAIRTRSHDGGSVSCAAHVRLDLAYTRLFRILTQANSLPMPASREMEITYKAEPTDDHRQVFVTVKMDDN